LFFFVVAKDATMKARRMVIEVVDEKMAAVLRRKTGAQRLKIVDALYRSAWNLIEMNVRSSHPDWDEPQVRAAVAARIAGGTN
jgi:2-keto-3-deoxy-6-phosphogluconate aldolase